MDPAALGGFTLEEAAERYGVPVRQLRRRAATGRLPGALKASTRHGEEWRVSAEVMESLGYRRVGGVISRETVAGRAPMAPVPLELAHADPPDRPEAEAPGVASRMDGQAEAAHLAAQRREALRIEREALLDAQQHALNEREERLNEREREIQSRESQLEVLAASVEARELAAADHVASAEALAARLSQDRKRLGADRRAVNASSVFVRAAEQALEQERQALEAEGARLQDMAHRLALERLEWAEERGRRGVGRSEWVEAP